MPLYIMLSSLSETGRQVLRKLPGSIRKVNAEVGRMGARVIAQYAVLGPYDFVTVLEAPDNETVSRISVELGARGSVQMMTMPAIPVDDFISRLASPSRPAPPAGAAESTRRPRSRLPCARRSGRESRWCDHLGRSPDLSKRSLAREGQIERD